MSDYGTIKHGKLKLKGNKNLFKVDRKRKRKCDESESKIDLDTKEHGGLSVCVETTESTRCYLSALDDGKFTLGAGRSSGQEPAPEQVFVLIKTPDDPMISLKTGYGKYLGVDSQGRLVAVSEAIGARERMEVVFQEGKTALQMVSNSCFVSLQPDKEGHIYACNKQAKQSEMVNVRTSSQKTGPVDWRPSEDRKSAQDCESAYVTIFQHSKVDLKDKHISIDVKDSKSVKMAQQRGDLHEHLLDRRIKTKSDKYC